MQYSADVNLSFNIVVATARPLTTIKHHNDNLLIPFQIFSFRSHGVRNLTWAAANRSRAGASLMAHLGTVTARTHTTHAWHFAE